MSIIRELQPRPVPWWVRRCLRSKRLSRWLLPTRSRRLCPVAHHDTTARGAPEMWLPACDFSEQPPLAAVGDLADALGKRPADTTHPAVYRRVLRNVTVHGLSNLVHVGDKVLHGDMVRIETDRIPEEYQPGVGVDVGSRTLRWPALPMRDHRVAEAVSLLDATAPNYAHWLTETLPKAALWTHHSCRPDIPLLVDSGLHPNIMRALELVVTPTQNVTLVPPRQSVHVDLLHHVSQPGHIPFEPRGSAALQRSHGTFSTAAMRMMCAAIKRRLGLDDSEPQDVMAFVRRTSRVRRLLNQDELSDSLARHGWSVISPDTMSFEEQVRLFHRARLVVGPTGAALANLLFARPGCRAGVMMSTHPSTPYFYWHNIARTCGVRVEYILCRPEAGCPDGVHSHFWAPIEAMSRVYGFDDARLVA